jgi:ppGpp synthetase/RelA/SpoT-type nucleotidyltranferase
MGEPDRFLKQKDELSIRRDYETRREGCEALATSVRLICESALRTSDIAFHSVKTRIKTAPSVLEKIVRKKYECSLNSVRDLIGIRIILLYPSLIDDVVELCKKEFSVIEFVDKRPGADSEQFGYSSVHLVCQLAGTPRGSLTEHARFAEIHFEVQIRTILQEAWAEIEHRLVYKSEIQAPSEIKRLIKRLSSSLEIADEQFQEIYEKRMDYLAKLKGTDISGLGGEPLNVDSLLEIIRRKYPWAVGWEQDRSAEDIESELGEVVKEFQDASVKTVKHLIRLIDKWGDDVFKASHHAYKVATMQVPVRTAEDSTYHLSEEGSAWQHRTQQYFIPAGHLRHTLRKEFPE